MSAAVPSFDSLVTNPGRLRILTALAANDRQEFVRLRGSTQLTDGNLCSHTRVLESAGLVVVEKSFRDRKPVTHVALTRSGRTALEQHARQLLTALGLALNSLPPASRPQPMRPDPFDADDWVD